MSPVYVKDLMGFSDSVKINDVSCKLQNIYLFDASMSQMGIALYVVTDKGVFVKLYDDFASEGKWYSEEYFKKYDP